MDKLFKSDNIKSIRIDEIGMCRSDYLDIIDCRLITIKGNTKTFGGLTLVGFGDVYQLPPVVTQQDKPLLSKYDSPFMFDAKCWDLKTVELTTPFRTTDLDQLQILSSIRTKNVGWEQKFKDLLDIVGEYRHNTDILHLCAYKENALTINQQHFNKLQGKVYSYKAKSFWCSSCV